MFAVYCKIRVTKYSKRRDTLYTLARFVHIILCKIPRIKKVFISCQSNSNIQDFPIFLTENSVHVQCTQYSGKEYWNRVYVYITNNYGPVTLLYLSPWWNADPVTSERFILLFELWNPVFQVLLSTHMFVGGFLGFFLDNTIPGITRIFIIVIRVSFWNI